MTSPEFTQTRQGHRAAVDTNPADKGMGGQLHAAPLESRGSPLLGVMVGAPAPWHITKRSMYRHAVADLRPAGQGVLSRRSARLSPQLLRPDRPTGSVDEKITKDLSHLSLPDGRHREIGWLATFNAACFFSLAIALVEDYIPDDFSPQVWRDSWSEPR